MIRARLLRSTAGVSVALACGCSPPEGKDSPILGTAPTQDTGRIDLPPSAPVLAIEPATPATGDDLTFVVITEPVDPNGDDLTWDISWSVDGVPAPEWTRTVSSEATAKGQVWELRAAVSDGQFTSDTALEIVVIGNTPPEAGVVLTPSTPTTTDNLRASPSGTDIDGDTIGYSIAWLQNGVNTGHTGLDVPAESTAAGETWSVVVTPSDPDGPGEAITASVVVVNSVPTVTAIDIDPSHPDTTDTLQSEFVGQDPDPEDILVPRYTWTVEGVAVGTDAELPAGSFVRGQEVGLSIALSDGSVEGPERFAEPVVIGNARPEISDALITPASPAPGDTVVCSGVGWFDADGDAEGYDYIWSLDGTAGPTVDHWHLASSTAVGGETLTCTLVPHDGIDAGSSITVSTTVVAP